MGITLGQTVSITLPRTIQKHAMCEHCGTAFRYEMHRVVKSEATNILNLDDAGARTQAEYEAAVKLHRQLSNEVDAVPCPQCGLFQKDMVRKLRRQYRSGMKSAAIVSLLLGILSATFWLANEVDPGHAVTRWITGIGAVVGIGMALSLPIIRLVLRRSFQPNRFGIKERMSIAEGAAEVVDETHICEPDELLSPPEPFPRRILQIFLTVVIVVAFLWIGLLKDESLRNSARKEREERERIRQEALNEHTKERLKELMSKSPGELDEATRRLFGIKEKPKGSSHSSEPDR